MGVKFLKKGDPEPPSDSSSSFRLYSMLYCPYAHRPRLVFAAKCAPFQMVDINLVNKPEWFTSVNPEGKVPTLSVGGRVITESLDISDYLDCQLPQRPLWPADSDVRARHKRLLQEFEKLYMPYVQVMRTTDPQAVVEVVPTVVEAMRPFEEELETTGTTFFGGDGPGMLDYMTWPWAERCEAVQALYPQLKFPTENFPRLMTWGAAMKEDPAVQATALSPEQHAIFIRRFAEGVLNYDEL